MKRKITVRVGDPVLAKYAFGGGEYIRITNTVSVSIKYSSLKGAVNDLQQMLVKYRDRYEDLQFEESRDCGCRYNCDCSPTLLLVGKRYETDLEYQLRLKQEAAKIAENQARDEKQLEELAKRLGKTIS